MSQKNVIDSFHAGWSLDAEGKIALLDVESKVDRAVRYINEKTILSGIELAQVVGGYILETFFEGDYSRFADPSRSKSVSFRSLLGRDDLLLGNATLYAFVRISHQLESLPADLASKLTLSHHRALLPLKDPRRKGLLAQQALEEKWPAEKLAGEVRKLLPKSRSGRKPLPSFAKGIHKLVKALEVAFAEEVTTRDVEKLGQEQSCALIDQVDESLSRLERLKRDLEKAMAEQA